MFENVLYLRMFSREQTLLQVNVEVLSLARVQELKLEKFNQLWLKQKKKKQLKAKLITQKYILLFEKSYKSPKSVNSISRFAFEKQCQKFFSSYESNLFSGSTT